MAATLITYLSRQYALSRSRMRRNDIRTGSARCRRRRNSRSIYRKRVASHHIRAARNLAWRKSRCDALRDSNKRHGVYINNSTSYVINAKAYLVRMWQHRLSSSMFTRCIAYSISIMTRHVNIAAKRIKQRNCATVKNADAHAGSGAAAASGHDDAEARINSAVAKLTRVRG